MSDDPHARPPRDGSSQSDRALGWGLLGAVVVVTAIAPLATDMYVPGFPQVARDLHTAASAVQLTLTSFFVGMALGQLVGGPFSDARGRRLPLLGSLVVFAAASVACALAPSIALMLVARFLQGAAGGVAMVVARAVVVDLSRGVHLVRNLNLVSGIGGAAPVLGPLMGGAIIQFAHWRVSFWLLTALALLMVAAVTIWVPESLPVGRRTGGGLRAVVSPSRVVLRNRRFVMFLVCMALSMGVTFAYVSTSAFILQSMNGLSPIAYSVDFAANAVGLALATLLAARLTGRVSTERIIGVGLALTLAAGVVLLLGATVLGMRLWLVVPAFFVLMSAQGFVGANSGALASDATPDHPGTGSALLGFTQWCAAGIVAPLAGLGGDHTAVPMAVIIIVLSLVSALALRAAPAR